MPDNLAMFEPLTEAELSVTILTDAKTSPSTKMPIVPVPPDAPPLKFQHPKHGEPTQVWPYHDLIGGLVGYAARFDFVGDDGTPGKDVLPLSFCDLGNGRRGWRSKAFPSPRPLYRLPELVTVPDALVVVTEGEKKADRVSDLFPGYVGVCTAGGAKAAKLTDLSPLQGRRVVIWPDHDPAGAGFAEDVARRAIDAGAVSVAVVQIPSDWPVAWDIADTPPPGVTTETLRLMLDSALPWQPSKDASDAPARPWPFRLVAGGVEKRVERTDRDTGDIRVEWRWFCSTLEVQADTRDTEGEAWGRLLRVVDRDGRAKTWAMPMALLAGDGTAYRERLLSMGLVLAPGGLARDALDEYVSTAKTEEKARCVSRIGWHGKSFVTSSQTFGE